MTNMRLTKVTQVYVGQHSLVIARDEDGFYWAIDPEAIAKDGTITKKINGLQGLRSDDRNKTIKSAMDSLRIKDLMDHGATFAVASVMVFRGLSREAAGAWYAGLTDPIRKMLG